MGFYRLLEKIEDYVWMGVFIMIVFCTIRLLMG